MSARTTRTIKKRERVVSALEGGASVTSACRLAGIGRTSYYEWRKADEAFAAETDAAIEAGTDLLEDVALRRATTGTQPSDTLLIFLLKARRPAKFRDHHRHELTGSGGTPLVIQIVQDGDDA